MPNNAPGNLSYPYVPHYTGGIHGSNPNIGLPPNPGMTPAWAPGNIGQDYDHSIMGGSWNPWRGVRASWPPGSTSPNPFTGMQAGGNFRRSGNPFAGVTAEGSFGRNGIRFGDWDTINPNITNQFNWLPRGNVTGYGTTAPSGHYAPGAGPTAVPTYWGNSGDDGGLSFGFVGSESGENYPAPGTGAPPYVYPWKRSPVSYTPFGIIGEGLRRMLHRSNQSKRNIGNAIPSNGRPNSGGAPAGPPTGTRRADQYYNYGTGQLETLHDVSGPGAGREFRLGLMADVARPQPTNLKQSDVPSTFRQGVWHLDEEGGGFSRVGERTMGARSHSGTLINSPEGIAAYNRQATQNRQPFGWLLPYDNNNTPSGPPALPGWSDPPMLPPIFQDQGRISGPPTMPPIWQGGGPDPFTPPDEFITPMPPNWQNGY